MLNYLWHLLGYPVEKTTYPTDTPTDTVVLIKRRKKEKKKRQVNTNTPPPFLMPEEPDDGEHTFLQNRAHKRHERKRYKSIL